MHRIISGRLLLILSVAAAFVFAALTAIIPADALTEILNGIFLGIVGAVTIVFMPLFIRSIRAKNFDRVSQLTFGIILAWFALILSRALSVYLNATDIAMRDGIKPLISFVTYLAILSGILHITAPGMVEDKWKYNRGLLLVAITVGAGIAGVTIYLQKVGLPSS